LGEDAESVVARVHGEVDEDVDLVEADAVCDLLVGKCGDVTPMVTAGVKLTVRSSCDGIRA